MAAIWNFYTFTWVYLNTTFFNPTENIRNLTETEIRYIIINAFRDWADVANLNFVEEPYNNKSDIRISFHRGRHMDDSPFDGPGNTLAHAHLPYSPFKGDIHFDLDEVWTKVMFEGCVKHEIGHMLGLKNHSTDPKSVMYSVYVNDMKLNEEDIQRIQEKYGPRRSNLGRSYVVYDKESSELRFKLSFKSIKELFGLG